MSPLEAGALILGKRSQTERAGMSLGRKRREGPCYHHQEQGFQLSREERPKKSLPRSHLSAWGIQLSPKSTLEQVVFKLRFTPKISKPIS